MRSPPRGIEWVGEEAALQGAADEVRSGGCLGHTGLIDCHTHLVFRRPRATEYAERRADALVRGEFARAGGGISHVRAVRAASRSSCSMRWGG